MSSLSLVSQEVASSARLVFQAAETEGKRLRAHRLQLLGEKCLEIVVISEGSGGGGGAGKKKKKKVLFGVMPSIRVFMKQKEESELILKGFFAFLNPLPMTDLEPFET